MKRSINDYRRTTLDMSSRTLKQIQKHPHKPLQHGAIVHTEIRPTFGGMTDRELSEARIQAAKYKAKQPKP